jgi:molybdenum cofactor cytidylyltransferase
VAWNVESAGRDDRACDATGASSIGLILLAAGASIRMSAPKQLLTLGNGTLLRNAVETAVTSECRPVLVVLGAYADRLRSELDGLPVRTVINEQWEEGIGSSLRAGMEALDHDGRGRATRGVVVMLCDQALVTAAALNRLVVAYRSSGKGIVASEYSGTVGVPALFDRKYFSALAGLSGAAGAKRIMELHESDSLCVPFPEGAVDIDTPEDYWQLRQGRSAVDP